MTDPAQMTPAELDEAIATEVMNAETFYWHQRDQPHKKTRDAGGIWIYAEKGGNVTALCGHDCRLWKPSSLISDTFAAEAQIEKRKLHLKYMTELEKILPANPMSDRASHWWRFTHAMPDVRCRAMLATVRSRDTKKPAVVG